MKRFICVALLIFQNVSAGFLNHTFLDTTAIARAVSIFISLESEKKYIKRHNALTQQLNATQNAAQKELLEEELESLASQWRTQNKTLTYTHNIAGALDCLASPLNKKIDVGQAEKFVGFFDFLAQNHAQSKNSPPTQSRRIGMQQAVALTELLTSIWRNTHTHRNQPGRKLSTVIQRMLQLIQSWLRHNSQDITLTEQWQHFKNLSRAAKWSLVAKVINIILALLDDRYDLPPNESNAAGQMLRELNIEYNPNNPVVAAVRVHERLTQEQRRNQALQAFQGDPYSWNDLVSYYLTHRRHLALNTRNSFWHSWIYMQWLRLFSILLDNQQDRASAPKERSRLLRHASC